MGGANVAIGSSILPPPSVLSTWPAPNYIDPITRSDRGPIICTIIAGIVVICVALRLWTRAFVLRSFGLDDWLIAWAVVGYSGLEDVNHTLISNQIADTSHRSRCAGRAHD